jgi:hypothetical protein
VAVDTRDLTVQLGVVNDQFFGLLGSWLNNPDTIGVPTFQRMLLTDETVGAANDFLVLAVLSMLGDYQNETAPEATDLVNEALENMQGNIRTMVTELLSSLWAGYSVSEVVYKPVGSRLLIDRVATYHPNSIRFRPDAQGQLDDAGILQFSRLHPGGVAIPPRKAIVLTHNKRFGNHYGQSYLHRAYKSWLLKDHMLKAWGKAQDRFGTPLLGAFVPAKLYDDPEKPGQKIRGVDLALRMLSRVGDMGAFAFELPDNKDMPLPDIRPLTAPAQGMGESFHTMITYLNKAIFRATLLPSMLMDEGTRTGSMAMSKTHADTFNWVVGSIFSQLNETLVEQLVRPLVDLNLGPQADYGAFVMAEERSDEQLVLAQVLHSMTVDGYLEPSVEADWQWARQQFDMPDRAMTSIDVLAQQAAQAGAQAAGLLKDDPTAPPAGPRGAPAAPSPLPSPEPAAA